MAHGGGKAAGAGLLAVLGLGVARSADNCAAAGLHGGRAVGELGEGALRGSKAVWGADDALRGATRLSGNVPDDVLARARVLDGISGADDARHGAGALQEGVGEAIQDGVELGVQTIDLVAVDQRELPPPPQRTVGPSLVDATVDAAAWDAFIGGLGIACVPMIVIGTATDEPDVLRVGKAAHAVGDLATECTAAGGHCIFVACDADDASRCVAATTSQRRRAALHPDLAPYQTALVAQLLLMDPPAAWIAVTSTQPGPRQLRIAHPADDSPPR